MSGLADREKHRPASSKYDPIKVKVWLTSEDPTASHYFIFSRYLLCRMLTVTKIPHMKAVKIAMELKKQLVDNDLLEVTQEKLEEILFAIMDAYEYDSEFRVRYRMVNKFLQQKRPLVILICGTPCSGKSTLAQMLASRFNLPNVVQTDIIHELMSQIGRSSSGGVPLWERSLSDDQLIQAFKQEAAEVRRAVTGDLMKAAKDGKSIIMEGFHLDPGLFLYEFGKYGVEHLLQEGRKIANWPLKSPRQSYRRSSLDTDPALSSGQDTPSRSNLMRRSATLPELGSPSHTIRDSKLGLGHESFPRNHLGNRASFALAQPDKVNSPQIMVSELRHNVQVSSPMQSIPVPAISTPSSDQQSTPLSPASEWLQLLQLEEADNLTSESDSAVPPSSETESGKTSSGNIAEEGIGHKIEATKFVHEINGRRGSKRKLLKGLLTRLFSPQKQTSSLEDTNSDIKQSAEHKTKIQTAPLRPRAAERQEDETRRRNESDAVQSNGSSQLDSPIILQAPPAQENITRNALAEIPRNLESSSSQPSDQKSLASHSEMAPIVFPEVVNRQSESQEDGREGRRKADLHAHQEPNPSTKSKMSGHHDIKPFMSEPLRQLDPDGSQTTKRLNAESGEDTFSSKIRRSGLPPLSKGSKVVGTRRTKPEDPLHPSTSRNFKENLKVSFQSPEVPDSVFSSRQDSSSGEETQPHMPEYLRLDSDLTQAESLAYGHSEQYSSEGEKELHKEMQDKLALSQRALPPNSKLRKTPLGSPLQTSMRDGPILDLTSENLSNSNRSILASTGSKQESLLAIDGSSPQIGENIIPGDEQGKTSRGATNTPVFIPVIICMADKDRDMLVAQKLQRSKVRANSKEQIAHCQSNLKVLEEHLMGYTECNVPVLRTSLPELSATADLLHDYLLECVSLQMKEDLTPKSC